MKTLTLSWPDDIVLLNISEHHLYHWRALVMTEFDWNKQRIPVYGGDYGDTAVQALEKALAKLKANRLDMANRTGPFSPASSGPRASSVQRPAVPVDPSNPLAIRI